MRALLLLAVGATSVDAATLTPMTFAPNPGALDAYEYVPDALAPGAPLVVALHGCTQTAMAMQSAGWNALADRHGFAVIYPEQRTANNSARCFNWAGEFGDPANLERGSGENASIIAMVDEAIARHQLDPSRVFVVGLSAGGAMTAVMMATWPERFAAGAIIAGIPYRCATDLSGAFTCQNPGVSKSADEWGDLVRAASSVGAFPRVQIWQGDADSTVVPRNADELVEQWTNVHGTDASADATESIGETSLSSFVAGDRVVVERYLIAGMGHGVAIGGPDCPARSAAFFLDVGVCSTTRAAEFFGLTGGSPGDPAVDGGPDPAGHGGCRSGRSTSGLVFGFALACWVLSTSRARPCRR